MCHAGAKSPHDVGELLDAIGNTPPPILARGQGRSYGDCCLNEDGYLILLEHLNRISNFDPVTGILRCESGVTFDQILQFCVPRGWFLPVTPGTKFVSVGGSIANDVHGKNHHRAGSFGNHVVQLELLRSDGSRIVCSDASNRDWFRATIGGLGLTGIILWADIRQKPISGPYVEVESIKFRDIDEFLALSMESDKDYEYTVAWLDGLDPGKEFRRGILFRGNHSEISEDNPAKVVHGKTGWLTVPFDMPSFILSKTSVRLFNKLVYQKGISKYKKKRVHYDSFFYPLDRVLNWNKLYGRKGFLEWQCVIPYTNNNDGLLRVFEEIINSKLSAVLVGLKVFGNVDPVGILSFPRRGITLAVDFPAVGNPLFDLLDRLDSIVRELGGGIYPAKDARMSCETFFQTCPSFGEFEKFIDPNMSSSFFRRVTKGKVRGRGW